MIGFDEFIKIEINDLETVKNICRICEKYRYRFETDVCYQRYVVDGISFLGVTSLMGKTVTIKPITGGHIDDFIYEMEQAGAYIEHKK